MNLLIEIVGKEPLRVLFLVGAGALLTKIVQARKMKIETPEGPIEVEF